MKIRTDREEARLDICYVGSYLSGTFRSSDEVSEASFFLFESLPLLPKDQYIFIEHALRVKVKNSLLHPDGLLEGHRPINLLQRFQRYLSH